MEGQYLQAGFEIKLACDALSRRILRWHWEKTPRPNSLKELMKYVEKRTLEAPDYYANITLPTGSTTWQQLDTTFCTRVLLDSESNASVSKKLLQHALHEGAARHACNGLRVARNAAAHATDKAGVVKAIATFDETIADLERAYGAQLLTADELEQYEALVKKATLACKGKAATNSNEKKTPKTTPQKQTRATPAKKATGGTTKRTTTSTANKGKKKRVTKRNTNTKKKVPNNSFRDVAFMALALLVFLAAISIHLLNLS